MQTGKEIHNGKLSGAWCAFTEMFYLCVRVLTSHRMPLLFWGDVQDNCIGMVDIGSKENRNRDHSSEQVRERRN